MNTTPAVGVSAGRIGGRVASMPWSWSPALRSALLATVVAVCLVGSIGAWLFVGAGPVSAAPNSLGLRATYDVDADIQWAQGTMGVISVAHVKNTTSGPVSRLTFNLLPLRLSKITQLSARAGGQQVTPNVTDQSLIVPLPGSLAPDDEINVRIDYRATFNTNPGGKRVLLMKKDGIAAAYRWIPWLSRQQKFNTPNFGESWVTAVSPRVTVRFTSDVTLKYATSGEKTGGSGQAQTFVATNVRDFNFSASPHYSVKKVSWGDVNIRVFYRTYEPSYLLDWTIRALERFTDKVGAYPYDQFVVAETPAGVGMESPGLVWIDATLGKSQFAHVVVHEAAHQWFYGTIGNNQATDPFLDEAVSDFLTRDLLGSFRNSECAEARLDKSVYAYHGRCYPEVIYVQGALYLRDYKAEVGANAFWTGMRNFYRDRKFGIAGTRSLFDYLDAASGFNSQRHEDRFPSLY